MGCIGFIRAEVVQARGSMVGKEGDEAASEDLSHGHFCPQ